MIDRNSEQVAFPEQYLVAAVPKWWQFKRRRQARRWWKQVQEGMRREDFAFNGTREDLKMWDDLTGMR